MKWFQLAAEQGDADGESNLGVMYANGQGVPQNYTEAVKWFRLAAEQGEADAQSNLGAMYANGQGVPQDNVQAQMWFSLAAAQGNDNAVKHRNLVAARITPDQLAEHSGWRASGSPPRNGER